MSDNKCTTQDIINVVNGRKSKGSRRITVISYYDKSVLFDSTLKYIQSALNSGTISSKWNLLKFETITKSDLEQSNWPVIITVY